MKTIIAGSREIVTPNAIALAVYLSEFDVTEVVSGAARGIDSFGEEYARREGIPVKRFPADWEKHGKAAGYLRNIEMGDYADALIAIWDGKSRGTKHMIEIAYERQLPIFVSLPYTFKQYFPPTP